MRQPPINIEYYSILLKILSISVIFNSLSSDIEEYQNKLISWETSEHNIYSNYNVSS